MRGSVGGTPSIREMAGVPDQYPHLEKVYVFVGDNYGFVGDNYASSVSIGIFVWVAAGLPAFCQSRPQRIRGSVGTPSIRERAGVLGYPPLEETQCGRH
jgi:hypothetical protein